MRKILWSLPLLALVTIAPMAFAQDEAPDVPPPEPWQGEAADSAPSKDWGQGFYIMAGGATGIDMRFAETFQDQFGVEPDVSTPVGLNVRLGARTRHLGAEFQVEWLPAFKVTDPTFLRDGEYSMVSLSGNLHLVLMTGRVQPYLLVGGGYNLSRIEPESPLGNNFGGWSLRGGGGLDVFLTRKIAVTADVAYVFPTGDLTDTDYLAIGWGLKYVF